MVLPIANGNNPNNRTTEGVHIVVIEEIPIKRLPKNVAIVILIAIPENRVPVIESVSSTINVNASTEGREPIMIGIVTITSNILEHIAITGVIIVVGISHIVEGEGESAAETVNGAKNTNGAHETLNVDGTPRPVE